jgi:hypothetical protein
METIPQRDAMQIAYYDIASYREVSLDPQSPPRFLDFDYNYNLDVTEEMQGINSSYIQTWVEDVNEVKAGLYDQYHALYPFTHFTKLAYMYVELLNNGHYKFPILYSPHGHAINGGSRMLVQTQFFPHLQWDAVRYKFNDHTTHTLDPLVNAILKNKYWQNNNNNATRVRALLEKESPSAESTDYYYSLSDIEFTQRPLFVFGKDWTAGTDYLENFDYSTMVEKISQTTKLWDKIRYIIKKYPTKTLTDYKDLLDIVVLDNVDFVKKWHSDFL